MKLILALVLALGMAGRVSAAEYNYYYYLGPFQVVEEMGEIVRKPPTSTVGVIDLTPPEKAGANIGFFATTKELVGYTLLLHGDIIKDVATEQMKDDWETVTGYRSSGATLVEMLWEQLTTGSDPTGKDFVKPLMPTSEMLLELHLGGHSLIKSEKFVYGVHPHTAKVKDLIKNDYRKMRDEDIKNDSKNYLKVLDFLGEKYKVVKPEDEFIPDDLPKEKPIKHSTTITESFNTADSDTLGPDLAWTEYQGDIDVVSNQAEFQTLASSSGARANTQLSSSDNYSQVDVIYLTDVGSGAIGTTCRQDTNTAATINCYYGRYVTGGGTQLYSYINGSITSIGTDATGASVTLTVKTQADGSTISVTLEGVEEISGTNTGVSAGTYCGIRVYNASGGTKPIEDDFEAGDLAVGGANVLPIQTIGRGMAMGMFRGGR